MQNKDFLAEYTPMTITPVTVQSGSHSVLDCHIVTPQHPDMQPVRLQVLQYNGNQVSVMTSQNLHLHYHQLPQMIYQDLELNLAEKPTILVIKSLRFLAGRIE